MFRKFAIAIAAATTIGAALAPTSASAHHHRHYGWGAAAFGAGMATALIASHAYYPRSSCYQVRRWVDTPYGMKLRRFWVC